MRHQRDADAGEQAAGDPPAFACLLRSFASPRRLAAAVPSGEHVPPIPDEPDGPPRAASASVEDVSRFCWVTTSSPPVVERDDVSGIGAEIDDLADAPRADDLVVAGLRVRLAEPDLLGPDGERAVLDR